MRAARAGGSRSTLCEDADVDRAVARLEGELVGRLIPDLSFQATARGAVQLSDAALGDFVLFIYPRISRPDEPGATEWVLIPGARGCTAESCVFRDLADDFHTLGLSIYGLSTQDSAEQLEAAERLHLTYPLLSDPELELGRALGLSTFHFEGRDLYKRSTLVVRRSSIVAAQLEVSNGPAHPYELLAQLGRGADR